MAIPIKNRNVPDIADIEDIIDKFMRDAHVNMQAGRNSLRAEKRAMAAIVEQLAFRDEYAVKMTIAMFLRMQLESISKEDKHINVDEVRRRAVEYLQENRDEQIR